MALTARNRRFVDEYMVDGNATQAAIRAGYSRVGANRAAHRLLQDEEIGAAIANAQAARSARTQIDADWVLIRLARIADSDIRKLFHGRELKLPEDLDDDTASALASIEVVTVAKGEGEVEYVSKMKFWDKRAALVDIGRHLGMFKDKLDVEHSGGIVINISSEDAEL